MFEEVQVRNGVARKPVFLQIYSLKNELFFFFKISCNGKTSFFLFVCFFNANGSLITSSEKTGFYHTHIFTLTTMGNL